MKNILRAASLALVLTACSGVAGVSATAQPPNDHMGMGSGTARTVVVAVKAGLFLLTLKIGPLEAMYSQSDYQRKHPHSGEVMLHGSMMMGGMGMAMPNRHLELHVMDTRTMHAVSNAMVSISYQQVATMGMKAMRPTQVPVALMMGIGKGMGDVHYGNNVYMPAGMYTVWVHVNKNMAYAIYKVTLT